MRSEADVAVIGGGVIGAAISYYLCREGYRVTLLERRDLAGGASGANPGGVSIQSKKAGLILQMALASARMYPDLSEELGTDLEYERLGGLIVIETEEEWRYMQQLAARQREAGVPVETLNGEEVRRIEPALSPHVLGANFSTADAVLNALRLTLGFARAARRLGATLRVGTPVTGIEVQGGRVLGVKTPVGDVHASWVVNAAGAYAPSVGRMVGVEHPITPKRGQQLATEVRPGLIRTKMAFASHMLHKHLGTGNEWPLGLGISLRPTPAGNLLLGSTTENVGEDVSSSFAGVQGIAEYVGRAIPPLRDISILRSWSGLRPATPDGVPLLGAVDGPAGYLVAAGHGGDGIALAAISGLYIAKVVASGGKGPAVAEFVGAA